MVPDRRYSMLGLTQWVHTMYPFSSDKNVYAYTIWIKGVQDLPNVSGMLEAILVLFFCHWLFKVVIELN